MRKIQLKCILWYTKVLSALVALSGVVSCASSKKNVSENDPVMDRYKQQPEIRRGDFREIMVMYGPLPGQRIPIIEELGDTVVEDSVVSGQ